MLALIRRVEACLSAETPEVDRLALGRMRRSVIQKRPNQLRKTFERRLDALVTSSPALRSAADQHISDLFVPALENLHLACESLERLRARRISSRPLNKAIHADPASASGSVTLFRLGGSTIHGTASQ